MSYHVRLWLWPTIIMLSSAVTTVVVVTDLSGPIRTGVALWYLLVCPGMALTRLLRLDDIVHELTVALALSLVLNAVVSIILVYSRFWSPPTGLFILIIVSIIGCVAQIWTDRYWKPDKEELSS